MHLKKPAVISVRVPWGTRVLLEEVALKAGVPYSDFIRMALLIGARQQAVLFGVPFDLGVDRLPEFVSGKVPTYAESMKEENIRPFYSSGEITDDWEERFGSFLDRLALRPKVASSTD
jgi:hypothetical protein